MARSGAVLALAISLIAGICVQQAAAAERMVVLEYFTSTT